MFTIKIEDGREAPLKPSMHRSQKKMSFKKDFPGLLVNLPSIVVDMYVSIKWLNHR